MQTSPSARITFGLQPPLAWITILAFILVTFLCLLVHVGGLLRMAYPAGAFLVGLILYQRYPVMYLSFAWWIAFLTPLVRRLVDLQSGWVDPSPILLAPFLVIMISVMKFFRDLPKAYQQVGLPFVLCATGIGYGLLVGLVRSSPTAVVVPLLNWFAPLLLGFFVYANWRDYPIYRQNLQRTFVWGTLVTGLYGIWQFLVAPAWDRYWLVNTEALTFGIPEPLGIRVFSSMNSPGPFASVMMAGLVLLLTSASSLRFMAAGAGYLAFLLSLVRSAWLGWVVAVVTFLPSLKTQFQVRFVVTALMMMIFVIPIANLQPFSEVIAPRVETFFNTRDDVSFNDRMEGYGDLFVQALLEISGNGFGFVITNDTLGSNDSGILTMLFTLGWVGTLPYLGGILLMFVALFQSTTVSVDPVANAARAIALGSFAQVGLGNPMLALSGMVFWGFLGLALAAKQYHANSL